MQVSNIEITVSNEVSQVVAALNQAQVETTLRFTDLQAIGGGSIGCW